MEEQKAQYRYRDIIGPTRIGSLELEGKRIDLPLLLDMDDGLGTLKAISLGGPMEDMKITLKGSYLKIPDPLLSAFRSELNGPGGVNLLGYVSGDTQTLELEFDGSKVDSSALVLRYNQLLAREPFKLVKALLEMRSIDPLHPPIYLPGAADHTNLEFLIYLGVEILDVLSFRTDSLKGIYHAGSGPIHLNRLLRTSSPELLCSCNACSRLADENISESEKIRLLLDHNIGKARVRFQEALLSHREGTLRERLMSSLAGKPEWMAALRKMEMDHLHLFERSIPTYRKVEDTKVTYREDLNSPDHALWRSRITNVYEPVTTRPIMLLLPCSARKPYSTSRTHQRITDALSPIKGWRRFVHRIVITSPLGLVPMELDDLYPASYYDIPVTGIWQDDEIRMIREMTSSVVQKEVPNEVICFHGEGREFYPEELEKEMFGPVNFTNIIDDGKRSLNEDLSLLRNEIYQKISEMKGQGFKGKDDDIRSLIRFSLGCDVSEMEDLFIRNTRNGRAVFRKKDQLFNLRKGGPIPTKIGGRSIWDLGGKSRGRSVIIEDFVPRGTIFGQGIMEASEDIHPGDIVIVGCGDDFRGVGRALVDSRVMSSNRPGPAVEMISHVKR